MTSVATESIQEHATRVIPTPVFDLPARKKLSQPPHGIWVSISNVTRALIIEFGRTHSEYYLSNGSVVETQECERQPLWSGRQMVWPERLWAREFESTGFNRECETKRSHAMAVYKLGMSK
jgi:hypothetical protein